MKIGDIVKLSDDGLKHDRDYYLKQGHPSKRNQALEFYNTKKALRGEIIGICDAPQGVHYLGRFPFGYKVKWNNNTISDTMAYRITADK
jgi:hypothetical protein